MPEVHIHVSNSQDSMPVTFKQVRVASKVVAMSAFSAQASAMEDDPEQEALFYIEGPDERGCVWLHSASSHDPWAQNLGPADKVAEVLWQWLGDLPGDGQRQSRRERMADWDADVARLDEAEEERKGLIDLDEVEKKI